MKRTKPSLWSRWSFVLVAVAGLLSVSPAWAVDEATRAALRDLGTEGVQAYQAGDYAAARQKLEEAFSIMRTAPLGLWSARALEKSGLLVQASERYLAAERAPLDPEGDQQAQLDARAAAGKEREALQSRIPRLKVRIEGAEPSQIVLVVDGKEVPKALVGKNLPVNPGKVEVTARSGDAEASGTAELSEGETKEIVLSLDPGLASAGPTEETDESSPQPSEQKSRGLFARKWPAFVAAGVGVAGGVVMTVFGVQSMDAKSKADACQSEPCDAGVESGFRQQAWDAGNVSTVGAVVMGVGVVGAGVLWFTLPGADSSRETALREPALRVGPLQRLQVGVRPGGLQLRGAF